MAKGKKPVLRLRHVFNSVVWGSIASAVFGPYLLLRDAEDYGRTHDIDRATINALSDRTAYIDDNSLPARIQRYTTLSGFFAPRHTAHARANGLDQLFGRCVVALKDHDFRRDIDTTTIYKPQHVTRVPEIVTVANYNRFIALHEMRHCHSDNDKSPLGVEADADIAALRHFDKDGLQSEMARAVLYWRALSLRAAKHDTALALDAAIRGETPPTQEEMKKAGEIFTLIANTSLFEFCRIKYRMPDNFYIKTNEIDPHHMSYYLRHLYRQMKDSLSPLAARRIELHLEAVAYYMPEIARNARQVAREGFPGTTCPGARPHPPAVQ